MRFATTNTIQAKVPKAFEPVAGLTQVLRVTISLGVDPLKCKFLQSYAH